MLMYAVLFQLVLEGCGELYCPWETFKEIALSSVDLNCIQEPLRSSTAELYEQSTALPTDGGDDDDTDDLWLAVGLTAAACTVFFLLLQVKLFIVGFYYYKSRHLDLDFCVRMTAYYVHYTPC